MIQLCISHNLRILNGRKLGDFSGKLTCYQHNGASTVDYSIISQSLWKNILKFSIDNLNPYSDHCPILLNLAVCICASSVTTHMPQTKRQSTQKQSKNTTLRYLWSEDSNETFLKAIQSPKIQSMINSFYETNNNTESSDEKIDKINHILHTTANLSIKIKTNKNSPQKRQQTANHQKWYTKECISLKNQLSKLAKQINCTNYNSLKNKYFQLKKKYKTLVKKAQRKFKKDH